MTVWYDKKTKGHRFDFWLFNQRHTSPRGFETEQEAIDAEHELRRSLRRQRAGLEPIEPVKKVLSPRFVEAAGAYYEFAKDRALVDDLETLDRMHRVILQFFGPRPTKDEDVRPGAPYHDLRLQDPIDDATWILKFESWMSRRGINGATKNRYRSAASRLYWFAMLPERRTASGIAMNPFRGLLRDKEYARDVVLTPQQLRAVMAAAPYYIRLAIVIAALAPKLRMGNILQLKWSQHFDAEMTTIKIAAHKTRGRTRKPLVAPISEQLRRILQAAKERQPKKVPWVIHYRKRPIKRFIGGLTEACAVAGIPYGRAQNGPTFHTIRHSAATQLAALGVSEGLRKDVMGHLSIQTTQGYTHLNPMHERAPLEQLSQTFVLEDIVTAPRLIGSGSASRGTSRVTMPARTRPPRPKPAKAKSTRSKRRKPKIA